MSGTPNDPTASAPKKKKNGGGIFSVSCGASTFMGLYLVLAAFNLYGLMYPLSRVDLKQFSAASLIHPLWSTHSELHLRVYLSTHLQFSRSFLRAEFPLSDDTTTSEEDESTKKAPTAWENPTDVALLWDEKIDAASLSQSVLLTTTDCDAASEDHSSSDNKNQCSSSSDDASYAAAISWLHHAEQLAEGTSDGSVLSAMSAASGQGIESTSFLLTIYEHVTYQLRRLLVAVGAVKDDNDDADAAAANTRKRRKTIRLAADSPLWSRLQSNSTLYIHALVLKTDAMDGSSSSSNKLSWPPTSYQTASSALAQANRQHAMLMGAVNMIKYEIPHHIGKPTRILAQDLVYLWHKYIWKTPTTEQHAPWEFVHSKPVEYAAYQTAQQQKEAGAGSPYWKPEVAIKLVNEQTSYPEPVAGLSGMPAARLERPSAQHPTGIALKPALHVDEIGLTSEKYIPVNDTVTSLPLRISFDRNDIAEPKDGHHHHHHHHTATSGGMSPARWRLLSHLSQALESQKQLGFEQTDIDDVRRLIADTNVTLLGITLLFSALHMLFEFLTFKSEVNFWRHNTDLTGLSVRSLFLDMIGQTVILGFLIEKDSSLLMTIPSGIGCLIALWKCRRAAGLQFVPIEAGRKSNIAWWNWIPSLMGYELRAMRLERAAAAKESSGNTTSDNKTNGNLDSTDLARVTVEADRIATRTLGSVLLPLVIGYTLYSFVREEHTTWYSWLVTSASSAVYALGFVLMTPQLFLNWKLKSVAHLPWRVLVYKSLNTFIDDLFSFIIRMPTMARISCFRDDIVFFIYLYQRWLYPVDTSRPVEGGGQMEEQTKEGASKEALEKKKRQ